ncbi:putative tRNA intron endonuclease [Oesophagostomum dentatum]|uniref:tRNA-intron lyase n=1 Tax=Oesophagostomum dentatum TaxID=61180 RepID=A0A0B1SU79_OESDE|nr:putative tRNA intron endonuclease [Oesophagostomum dentatum]
MYVRGPAEQRAALITAATIERRDDTESKSVISLQNYITVDYVNDSYIIFDKDTDTSKGQYHRLGDFDVPLPSTRDHRAREVILYDLCRKRYYLTSGEQFGCAYLVYEGVVSLPQRLRTSRKSSCKGLLEYVEGNDDISMVDMISLLRIATQAEKDLLLSIIASDSHHPHYLKFEWFKQYSKEFE